MAPQDKADGVEDRARDWLTALLQQWRRGHTNRTLREAVLALDKALRRGPDPTHPDRATRQHFPPMRAIWDEGWANGVADAIRVIEEQMPDEDPAFPTPWTNPGPADSTARSVVAAEPHDSMTRADRPGGADTASPGRGTPITVLCGSTRFYDRFREQNLRLTLAGHIVLSIGCDTRSDGDLDLATAGGASLDEVKARLDALHLAKIDLADEVLVIDVDGYIGDSTRREIEYARSLGRPVRYLSALNVGLEPGQHT
jgi:hypothetical protein